MSNRFPRVFQFPWRSRDLVARDIDAELEFHLDARVTELVAEGMPRDEARRRATEEFGDLDFTRRYCRNVDQRTEREMRVAERFAAWRQDAHYAWRTLRRSPGFATVSILTLALAIGANTAIFSVARAVLFKPLPFGDPNAVVGIYSTPVNNLANHWALSPPDIADYRARQHSFTGIAATWRHVATWLPTNAAPQIVDVMSVTANTFDVLGVRALHGRTFVTGEDRPSAPNTVVLSYGFWQREMGGDPSVVGRPMTLFDEPYTIVGVMPRAFTVSGREDLWIPLDMSGDLANASITRKQHIYDAVARLRPGVSLDAARADVLRISRQLASEYADADERIIGTVLPLRETMAADVRQPVMLLLGAALLVLLIACANLANLTLARTVSRRNEIAVRAALGAGRGRLARQLLTESVLLSLVGGGAGVGLAIVATRTLLALNPHALPPIFTVGIDGRVLSFSLALSVTTGLLFGLVPALDAGRADLHGALKDHGRGGTGGRAAERMRRTLVVAQVALAVVLLVGAGLLVRSFRELTRVQLGFDPDHVLTAELRLDGPKYDSSSAVNRFFDEMQSEIAASPSVVAVSASMDMPTLRSENSQIAVEGAPSDPRNPPSIDYTMVRGDYFKVFRIPLVSGRSFDPTITTRDEHTAIVNQAAVRAFFPRGDALGHRIHIGPNPAAPWVTIIGVVGDVHEDGAASPAPPIYYDDARRNTWWRTFSLEARTSGDADAAIPAVRRAVHDADPTRAVRSIETLDDIVGDSLASRRLALGLAAAFAVLALALAAVGIYGVLAYSVTTRTREFGVRIALGASRRSVLLLVLRQGLAWSFVGLLIGLGGALAGARLLDTMLFGIAPNDVRTYLTVAVGLVSIAIAASVVPALRATGVDPLTSMRAE
ncbi:MAG TPA: ABC transporter permease [Gemmatimonadaceae bacterium]